MACNKNKKLTLQNKNLTYKEYNFKPCFFIKLCFVIVYSTEIFHPDPN